MTATIPTAIRLPAELVQRYDNLAKNTGRSRTYYVTEALEDAIAELEYEYGLMKQVEDYRAGKLETVSLEEVERQLDLLDD